MITAHTGSEASFSSRSNRSSQSDLDRRRASERSLEASRGVPTSTGRVLTVEAVDDDRHGRGGEVYSTPTKEEAAVGRTPRVLSSVPPFSPGRAI